MSADESDAFYRRNPDYQGEPVIASTHDALHPMTTVKQMDEWFDFCYSCQRVTGPMTPRPGESNREVKEQP